jgi:hypothetical protein
LEIALLATEDPADYVVSFYKSDGALQKNIAVDGAVDDPRNSDYTIYKIFPQSYFLFTVGGNLSRGEANAVSLTNTSTNEVVDAYRAGTSWSVLTEGAGSGATATGTGS